MDAARENARLHRRPIVADADDVRPIDSAMEGSRQPPPFGIGADHSGKTHMPTERGRVVRGIAGAARDDLRRVVLENQDRRLARHPGHLAVDELVRNQIADDEDAAAREAVDEREQAFLSLGFARKRMYRTRDQHCGSRPSRGLGWPEGLESPIAGCGFIRVADSADYVPIPSGRTSTAPPPVMPGIFAAQSRADSRLSVSIT